MSTSNIYLLRDPETLKIRYIGSTKQSLPSRLSGHISTVKDNAKGAWITSLISRGLKPKIELVEATSKELSLEKEKFWTEYYGVGGDLLNSNKIKDTTCVDKGSGRKRIFKGEEKTITIAVRVPISKVDEIREQCRAVIKRYQAKRKPTK